MIIQIILLLAASALAAYPLIIKHNENAAEYIEKITPYKGVMGVILIVWGLIDFFRVLPHLDDLFRYSFFYGLVIVVTFLEELLLGTLLGYQLLQKHLLSKSAEAEEKGRMINQKLVKFQVPLGVAGFVLVIILIYFKFRYSF